MEIKRIEVELCFNLGDYENEKIRLAAQLHKNDHIPEVIETLRAMAIASGSEKDHDSWRRRDRMVKELKDLAQKLKQAQEQWGRTKDFLQAQGIKTDVDDMPQFENLLMPSPPTADAEIVDYDCPEF